MSMDRHRRLARLEEDSPPPPQREGGRQPGWAAEKAALSQSLDAWRTLMLDHGWSDEEIDEQIEWDQLVYDRSFGSGYEDYEVIEDWIHFVEAGGEWDDYPGPGYWGEGGS
jgi:hypothetical protein